MKVYALVGESGTGKSYKALELACEKGIKYIIDDGILIHNNRILTGMSAKQAKTKVEAVKRAIFHDISHRETVKNVILKLNIDKILVIGTSDKMVKQIASRLGIGEIDKIIYIKEISTSDEINIAKISRSKGNHVIPVPTVEVKSISSGLSINPLKRLFRRDNKPDIIMEKTIIRPAFSYIGKFYISPQAINQIIVYELSKFDVISKVNDVKFGEREHIIEVFVGIEVNLFKSIDDIIEIQKHIIKHLYKMTLIDVGKVDIRVNKVRCVKKKINENYVPPK